MYAQRCSTQHHRGAKVYMFFFRKNQRIRSKNEPCRPRVAQRAGLHWPLPPAVASTAGLGPHHPSPSFFFKKKNCVRMAPAACSKGKGTLFPKSQTTFLAQASLDYSTKGHNRQAQPRRDETSCGLHIRHYLLGEHISPHCPAPGVRRDRPDTLGKVNQSKPAGEMGPPCKGGQLFSTAQCMKYLKGGAFGCSQFF